MSTTKPKPTFYIPTQVPSSKNLTTCACTRQGKPYTRPHPKVDHEPNKSGFKKDGKPDVPGYIQLTDSHYERHAERFYAGYAQGKDLLGEPQYNYPVKVGFHFIRSNRLRFDFHNAIQIVADRMVHHNWLPDDDMDHLIPVPLYYTPPAKRIDWEFNNGIGTL